MTMQPVLHPIPTIGNIDERTRNDYLPQDHAASSASYPSNRESTLKDKKMIISNMTMQPVLHPIPAIGDVDERTRNDYVPQNHAASSASYPSNGENRLKYKKNPQKR